MIGWRRLVFFGSFPHTLLRGTRAQFVGIVYDQPDEQAAIRQAIGEFKMPANQRDKLMARRRD
jgi:hypothetical protein